MIRLKGSKAQDYGFRLKIKKAGNFAKETKKNILIIEKKTNLLLTSPELVLVNE